MVDGTLYPGAVLVPPLILFPCNSKGELIPFLGDALLLELTRSEMHALTGQTAWMHPPFFFRTALTDLVLPYKSLSCFRFDFHLCSGLLADCTMAQTCNAGASWCPYELKKEPELKFSAGLSSHYAVLL